MARSQASVAAISRDPPEQVTLIYRHLEGQHSFSILEHAGLVVLDHDLHRAFKNGLAGAGKLVSAVCGRTVEYSSDVSFADFKRKIDRQTNALNPTRAVTMTGTLRSETSAVSTA